MAGSHQGGLKARETNYQQFGKDFYRRIGAEGGKKGNTGGFFQNRELAKTVGAKGGAISTRSKNPLPLENRRKAYAAIHEFQEGFSAQAISNVDKRNWWRRNFR